MSFHQRFIFSTIMKDLCNCEEALDDFEILPEDEQKDAIIFLKRCKNIVDNYGELDVEES